MMPGTLSPSGFICFLRSKIFLIGRCPECLMKAPSPPKKPDYNYPVEDCDVEDKGRLRSYRAKRSEWLDQLVRDKEHSVWKQINGMLWNDAVFRTINEARRIAHSGGHPSAARNGKIARFMDQGFVATQTLSIRKLMDPPERKPERQVISLRRVLDDIQAHRDLLTRELYVAHDGLPYDPEPARKRFYEAIAATGNGVWVGSLPTTGPEAFDSSEMMHEKFDALSGVAPADRQRTDAIRSEVFERLEQALEQSGWLEIKNFGNKFVAHAADEHSRSSITGPRGLSLERLSHCHKVICQVTAAIYGPILWEGGYGLIPIPQFDQFEQLDSPWVVASDLDKLHAFWQTHVDAVEQWTSEDVLTLGN